MSFFKRMDMYVVRLMTSEFTSRIDLTCNDRFPVSSETHPGLVCDIFRVMMLSAETGVLQVRI